MKTEFVVINEVANDLDAGPVDRGFDRPAQHVEMAVGGARFEMDAGFDDGIAPALGCKARFDRRQDFAVGDLEFLDVETVEVGDVDRRHTKLPGNMSIHYLRARGCQSPYRCADESVAAPACRFHHSDPAGTWRRRKELCDWAGSWERDDDPPDIRRLGGCLFVCVSIRRNLCCFSLWLQRRPNSIGRANGSKRNDRGASHQTIRLLRDSHLTLNGSKRHGPDQ